MVNPSSNLIVSLMSFATFSGGTKGVVGSADVKPALINSIRLNLIRVALVDISCKFRVFDVLLKVRRHYNKVSALLLCLPYSIAGFYPKGFLRRSFWREQYRVVLLPNHRLRQDTSSKPNRTYIQPTHKSCSYRNAVLICSTKSPYFLEILRNLLTNQSVVLLKIEILWMELIMKFSDRLKGLREK